MNRLDNQIHDLARKAEMLNDTRIESITRVEERLSTCPVQWLQITKNFIKKIKNNINTRQELANELYKITILTNPSRMLLIIYELQEIDNQDVKAADMYKACMNEWEDY